MDVMNYSVDATYDLTALLREIPFLPEIDPAGQRVFVRADFNVPIDDNGDMADDGRLRAVLPTINYLLDRGASVIVASHMRNPLEGRSSPAPALSFAPLARRLSRIWEVDVSFSPQVVGPEARKAATTLKPGQVLLLENLRFHPGETADDPEFARELASLADVYVNDAFGVCHRPHASMTTVTGLTGQAVGGYALKNELMALNRVLDQPVRPLAAVIGGRNVEAKLPVLVKLMGLADYVFLGGQMGDLFSRFVFGRDVAQPAVSENAMAEMEKLAKNMNTFKARLFYPIDAIVRPVDDHYGPASAVAAQNLSDDMVSVDIGPATRLWYREVLSLCRTIIWNGPMGAFETPAFARGTAMVTRAISECQGITLAGGVDTSAAILKLFDRGQISFLSSGGSVFLAALAGQPLVALEALRRANSRRG